MLKPDGQTNRCVDTITRKVAFYNFVQNFNNLLQIYRRAAKIQGIHRRIVRKNWLLPQLNTNYDNYILQLDGAPPSFHRNVRVLLNCVLQQRWIGRAAKGDNHLLPWPPRSPNLTPCDLFLWGFVKDSVYVPPLPMSLNELRDRITRVLQTITADTLHRVWDEFDYRVDVCHVTQCAHIEGL